MDDEALVVRLFNLWDAVEKEYKRRYEDAVNIEVARVIFERADHHIIAAQIQKERSGVRATREKQQKLEEGERVCIICGRHLTEGELKYIDKHGGKDICYHCKKEIAGK